MVKWKKNETVDFLSKNLLLILGALALAFLVFIITMSFIIPFILQGQELKPAGIAIIPLKGEISNQSGDYFSSYVTASEVAEMIEEADSDPSIGAIFLDIDSPGGEVVASKQIVYKIRETKKPIYSYIGSIGASGAYYAASASDYIFADSDSLTGSIGVISTVTNVQELMQNFGIKVTNITTGDYKSLGSPFDEFTEEERLILQEIIDGTFQQFRSDILEFRNGKISEAELDSVDDGRILSGRQALAKNLVDELLPKEKALKKVAELEKIKNPQFIEYNKTEPSFFDLLFYSGKYFGNGLLSSAVSQTNQIKIR